MNNKEQLVKKIKLIFQGLDKKVVESNSMIDKVINKIKENAFNEITIPTAIILLSQKMSFCFKEAKLKIANDDYEVAEVCLIVAESFLNEFIEKLVVLNESIDQKIQKERKN